MGASNGSILTQTRDYPSIKKSLIINVLGKPEINVKPLSFGLRNPSGQRKSALTVTAFA